MKSDVDAYNVAVAAAEAFLTEFPDSAFQATGNLASIEAYNPSFFSTYESAWAKNNFDYEEILYGESGQLTEHTLSAIGGDEKTQFYLGGQYMDEGGIIKNTATKDVWKTECRSEAKRKTKLSVSTNLVRSESDRGVTGNDNTNMTYGFSIGFTPSFLDIRQNSDGSFPVHPFNPSNPLETAEHFVNNEVTNRALGSFRLDYDVYKTDMANLSFLTVAGADFYSQENEVFIPPFLQIESSKDEAGQSVMTTTNNLNTNLSLNLVHKCNCQI